MTERKTHAPRAGVNRTRPSIYQEVTNKIIHELEQGCIPWVQPWGDSGDGSECSAAIGLPTNAGTKNTYSGINILLLWGALFERGFRSQNWLTYKQARKLGGNVCKGETSTTIVYADRFIPRLERQTAQEEGRNPQPIPFLKRYRVFNIEQCDGLPDELYESAPKRPECEQVPHAEMLIKSTGADFRIGGNQAFYNPRKDFIQVPPQPAFHDQVNYYRSCLHELGHWSGHPTRLDRNIAANRKTKRYAFEELVAEMTSAFVCASLSIKPTVRHVDYIGFWLEVLREDERAIFRAASLASKAANYLLDL